MRHGQSIPYLVPTQFQDFIFLHNSSKSAGTKLELTAWRM
jgi:hypothetical protein